MKSRALLNIGVAALTLAACAAHSGETKKTLRIQIPKSLANHKVLVTTGECGLFGGVFGPITSRPGMWEFSMNVRTDAAEVKVLACIPGYTIATLTMKPEDIPDAPIALNFRKLPTVPVTVKLTTYDGTPIPGKKVVLRQSIPEQEFLGYGDGAVFAPQAEPVATGVTNSRGMLSVRVPQILDDPIAGILQQPMSYKPYFWASVEPSEDGTHVEPLMFYAQKEYPDSQVLQIIHLSRITGKVKQSFLDKNNITEPMGEVDGPKGYKIRNTDKTQAPQAGKATVNWNDFSSNGPAPSKEEVDLHMAVASPEEIATCVSRLGRIMNATHLPYQLSANILPLSDWTVNLTSHIPPVSKHGKVFFVRYQDGGYNVQLTEGLGNVIVEIRRVDGSQMATDSSTFPDFAIQSAKEWLSAQAQPEDGGIIYDRHDDDEIQRQKACAGPDVVPLVVVWTTCDTPDKNKMKWNWCFAFTDGTTLRYELRCHIDGMMRFTDTFAPRPYLFGEKPAATPSKPVVSGRTTPTHKPRHVRKSATPAEPANQKN